MAGEKFIVSGIQKIEHGPAITTEAGLAGATWTRLDSVALDTVTLTKNADTETDIYREDGDAIFVTLYSQGEADTIAFNLLEQRPEVLALFTNNVYVNTTTTMTTKAKRKAAKMSLKLTTNAVDSDRKLIIIIPNVSVTMTYSGNVTKTGVQQLVLTGKIHAFTLTTGGEEATIVRTWVTESGAAISSPAIV